jgi:hypothetical protein
MPRCEILIGASASFATECGKSHLSLLIMLKKRNNFYPAIAAGLLVFFIFRLIHREPNKDVIMVNGVAISRKSCLSEINVLFEGRVDSNKACDCMLPGYYEMFKNNPAELRRLNEGDISALSARTKDSLHNLFTHCVGPYVLDTTFKMHLSGSDLASFKAHLAGKLRSKSKFNGINADSMASSIADRLNGNITILEYIGAAELDDSTVQRVTR